MTQEQKRIRLAEAAGWKGIVPQYMIGYAPWRPVPYEEKVKTTSVTELWSIPLDPLPDYFNDLNTVHEFEKVLTPLQWVSYWSFLEPLACRPNNTSILHATAAQRAEALGLTLNLWTP